MGKRIKRVEQVEIVHPNAAGLDIGAREIWACVPPDREGETVRPFGSFTPDLHRLADWLVANSVDTGAMESTGVYWVPAFEILEARGLKVYLVNARHIKNVPGRKSDVMDCCHNHLSNFKSDRLYRTVSAFSSPSDRSHHLRYVNEFLPLSRYSS